MRYIDTGTRDNAQALGAWLDKHAVQDHTAVALRWQTGYFGAGALGYFVPLMAKLRAHDETLRVLIGSNDGTTTRADIEVLLAVAGPPRIRRQIGVVSFKNAYFHPKTVHFTRGDGSAAAYVGSANLTPSGTTSLHVEAGVLLDTREGDDPQILHDIAAAVDWWFEAGRAGLNLVSTPDDLDGLVTAGILNVPRAVLVPRPESTSTGGLNVARLTPLLTAPALGPAFTVTHAPTVVASPPGPPELVPRAVRKGGSATPRHFLAAQWSKTLSGSDAQRKTVGNQRGSVTLVRGGHPINSQKYFRYQLFANVPWTNGTTRTGEPLQIAMVPFSVHFLGKALGSMQLAVTYAPNREAAQANYTSLLHLGALAPHFVHSDVSGRQIVLSRSTTGTFDLAIL